MSSGPARPRGLDNGQTSIRLAPINGLRGIAILAVIYFHLICGLWSADKVPGWLSPLLTNGWTGVNLFFILSGFVLFLPYASGERTMNGIAGRLNFYRHRSLRLLPLFYVAVLAEWLLAAAHGGSGVGELASVMSLSFVLNPHTFGPSFNAPLWSIGVEIVFSALFPMLVEAAGRRGWTLLLVGALALSLGARLAGISANPALEGASFNSDMFLCRLDEFVIGMMLAHLYAQHRLPGRAGLCAIAGCVLVALAWTGFDQVLRGDLSPLSRAVLNNVLDAGLSLVVIAALVPGTWFAAVLRWRPLQLLGMMCYSLYIWHEPLIGWLMPSRADMPADAFAAAVMFFALLILTIGALSYRFVEFGRVSAWRPLFLLAPLQHPV